MARLSRFSWIVYAKKPFREVRHVLIEQGMDIAREYYLAILLDRSTRAPVFIASAEGGTEIEEVAATRPDAILRVPVDPRVGMSPWIGRTVTVELQTKGKGARRVLFVDPAVVYDVLERERP